MSTHAIETSELSLGYGKFRAIDRLRLRVAEGSIHGFLGLNGAGKTTTLRALLGFLRPRGGSIALFGKSPRSRAVYRDIGVLFEDFAAPTYLRGREHLRLHARLFGLDRSAADREASRWLERVGLAPAADRRIAGYSSGMLRRLGLACALVHSPRLVLLDEPTNGLDPEGIRDFRAIVRELNREHGTTVFFSSHILAEVERVCSRVAIIHRGRLLKDGAIAELTGSAEPRYRIEVGDVARAERALNAEPECRVADESRRADATPDDPEPRRGEIDIVIDPERAPLLARVLVGAGVEIHSLRRLERSLEDVFAAAIARAGPEHEDVA